MKPNIEETNKEATGSELEKFLDWDVYDPEDKHVGKISCLWADPEGHLDYVGIKTTWLFGKTHVMPSHGVEANYFKKRVRIPYKEDVIKNAPSYKPDANLDNMVIDEVHAYYSRLGPQLAPIAEEEAGEPAVTPRFGTEAARGAAVTQEEARIPLHEERLKVGTREVEAGGVRLRKIIRIETVEQPVELKHEEISIERVPAKEGMREDQAGHAFEKEEDIYIPLRHQEPVIEKETHLREEVRAQKTQFTEKQTVSGEVRREDVEMKDPRDTGKR